MCGSDEGKEVKTGLKKVLRGEETRENGRKE
jgi:hypothetical protein